jgi:hypothetical protein
MPSSHIPYAEWLVRYGSLTTPDLSWTGHGRQGVGMLDVVMLILTIVSFAALFAFVAWLERV